MDKFANLDIAAHSGANGHNAKSPSTAAQNSAGNYAKGRETLYGLRIAIESPRGTLRHWKAADGTSGSNLMKFHYGYIMGTMGNDGDELDVSLGPWPEAQRAYVVNQNNADGSFDEHKLMLGFPDQRTAVAGYMSNFSAGWPGFGSCIGCSIDQLKWWIANGNKTRPLTKDQLPYEGQDTMEKVIWDSANPLTPLRSTLDKVLYGLRAHDAADGLLYDAVTLADVLDDADGVLTFDALVIPFARLQQRMAVMQKVLDRAGGSVKVAAMQVTDPFTQRGTTNVAVIWELTDGQTVTVFFHNPDTTPKKITPQDELISWKWMLNKKDITVVVAPEKGRDLEVRLVASRIMALAEKNSARFIAANGKRAEKLEVIASLKTELETKKATLTDLENQITAIEAERDAAGLVDPPEPEPQPEPEPEPQPEPAPAALDVDSMYAVVTSGDPMPGVSRGADWIVLNAPRPLLGTETMSDGEFLSGRFYVAIDPRDSMADAYLAEDKKLNGKVVFAADAETLTKMALNTINPDYLPAYMEMDEAARATALKGFIDKLNGFTYGRLKELAAMDMPVADFWKRDVKEFGFNRPGFFGRALTIMGAEILNQQPAGTWTVAKLESGKFVACFSVGGGWSYAAESDTIEQAFEAMQANAQYQAATAPAPEPEPAPAPTVPDNVRKQVENALSRLREIAEGVQAAKTLGGDGRYESEALANRKGDIEAAQATLTKFRESAPKNGIDAEAFITSLGGEPDLSPSPEALAWADKGAADKAAADKAAAEAAAEAVAQAQRDAEAAAAAEKAAKEAQEAQESDDGDFLAAAAVGDVDFFDKAVTDRLAALAGKYTDPDGSYLDMVNRAKTAAKNWFIAEFKKKVG